MKFLADECCELSLVKRLRQEGYQVDYIQEIMPGTTDDEVLLHALKEEKIIITEDKDFGELVYRLKKPAFGIILLRFHPSDQELKIQRLIQLINHQKDKLKGHFLVVDSEKIRIKPIH